jgi:multidrug transporter EmrE-like cation transporter
VNSVGFPSLTSQVLSVKKGEQMNALNVIAIALIMAGGLGLAYGSFSYTQETEQARIGSIELVVQEKQTVNIPVWVGVAGIMAGMLMLFIPKKS